MRTGARPVDLETSDFVALGLRRKGQEGMGTAGRQPFHTCPQKVRRERRNQKESAIGRFLFCLFIESCLFCPHIHLFFFRRKIYMVQNSKIVKISQ